jgi:hypothetical protein
MFKRLMDEVKDGGAGGSGGDAAAVAAAAAAKAAADAAGAGKDGKSLLASGQEKPEEWIPEKYRAMDKDGKAIDVVASARKGFQALTELQKRMVDVGLPPEDAEKYEIAAPTGMDLTELKKDPVFASKLKGYHALGMTNKQVQQVINDFAEVAPEIAAAAMEATNEKAVANLQLVWKTPEEMTAKIKASTRGAEALAKSIGLSFDDIEAYGLGNNPMFIRLMEGYARQIGEDSAPLAPTGASPSNEWDEVNKKLKGELDAIAETDVKARRAKLDQITAHYEKRYARRTPIINQQSTRAA